MDQVGTRQAFSVQVKRYKNLKMKQHSKWWSQLITILQSIFKTISPKIYIYDRKLLSSLKNYQERKYAQNVIAHCFSAGACGDAPEIPNAINVSDGYSNGSVTLYSCLTGFLANSESPIISCNGSDWSSSTFQCLGNFKSHVVWKF